RGGERTMTLSLGDLVTTGGGRFYRVRHLYRDGYRLEPLRRRPGRRVVSVKTTPKLVETAEVSRAREYLADGRRHALAGRDAATVADSFAAVLAWLIKATERGADSRESIATVRRALSLNISHLHE